MAKGGCHCGAVRYAVEGEMVYHAVCHCEDCRRSAGALMVTWMAFPKDALKIESGKATAYRSSENGERHFCASCGTGLFYYNETNLPGIVDIQSSTLDDIADHAPQIHVQVADSLPWESTLDSMPRFDRYPGP